MDTVGNCYGSKTWMVLLVPTVAIIKIWRKSYIYRLNDNIAKYIVDSVFEDELSMIVMLSQAEIRHLHTDI